MGVFKGYQPNIFRAVSGSLFSTAANWSRGYVPTGSDVATIADNCVIDVNRTIGSLVVRSPYTASINSGLTLLVKDIIDVKGHLSCSGNPNIVSVARKNNINSFSAASSSFSYSGSNQNVPGLNYYNLNIIGLGVKTLIGNTTLDKNLYVGQYAYTPGNLECSNYDLTVKGTTTMADYSNQTFSKNGSGNLIFYGLFNGANLAGNTTSFILSSSPNVEFRNGLLALFNAIGPSGGIFNSGTGTWRFTTNNQEIFSAYNSLTLGCNVIIDNNITLSINGISPWILNGTIDGANAASILNLTSSLYINNATKPQLMPTNGIFIPSASSNSTLGYIFNGNYQLPYPSYANLVIGGSGIKSLPAISSSVSASSLGFINLNGGPNTFDISASNFYCGPINLSANSPILYKTGPGTVTINGNLYIAQSTLDFRGGNPSVTLTGNLTNGANEIRGFYPGTGSWYFPSTVQSVIMPYVGLLWTSPLLISGTLKFEQSTNYISASINGTNSSAKLINSGTLYFSTENSLSSSFLTGSPDFTFPGNIVNIGGDYTATIPTKYSSSFYNLGISGLGTKSLANDMYISGSLTFGTTGLLDVSSSNLIVNGTTNTGIGEGILRKSGPGKITFIGKLITDSTGIDFTTGNPSFEFQNGLQSVSSGGNLNFGSGTCSFSVNNQTIDITSYGDQRATFKNILVSGSIAVTASSATYGWAYIHVSEGINGTVANSIFAPRTTAGVAPTIWYSGSQMPMQIGILDVSSSANIFIYASGSQDVKGGVYYNLQFLNGLKTLQGNVSVLGTFSTGSGATSGSYNLNGFTLTNP